MKSYISIIGLLLICSCRSSAQAPSTQEDRGASSETVKVFNCRGKEFSFRYPKEEFSKESFHNYAEGFFIALTYSDSSYIQIHCGGAVVRPLLQGEKYVVQNESKQDGISHRDGYIKGTDFLWREDYYSAKHLTLSFINVSPAKKQLFDQALETFKKDTR
jgi:hypothetical protein